MDTALLADTAEWRMIGLLLEYPSSGWTARVETLAKAVRDPDLRSAAKAALAEASEGMHHSLFGPGGPVSPREASYSSGVQLGQLLSELAAYYTAFAWHPNTVEPFDHISVEAGFVAWLKLKVAYATACADADHATLASEAVQTFVADHLSVMAEQICQRLEPVAPSYLVLAGRALYSRVGSPRSACGKGLLHVLDNEELGCAGSISGTSSGEL
jgi:nitrate reductase assembly molybdenum cofactor insertion protein NarJ